MKQGEYSRQEDRIIAQAYKENMSIKQLSKILDRSENSVASRVRKLNVIRCFNNDDPFVMNWNPEPFSMEGKATAQSVIFRSGMKL